jgi:putative endonuclease
MPRDAYVYFMANERNTVLYAGVTSDLVRRVAEHKLGVTAGFTSQYNCTKLIYYEASEHIADALAREKQLKNWRRSWKEALIDELNPRHEDLSERIGVTPALLAHLRSRHPGSSPG